MSDLQPFLKYLRFQALWNSSRKQHQMTFCLNMECSALVKISKVRDFEHKYSCSDKHNLSYKGNTKLKIKIRIYSSPKIIGIQFCILEFSLFLWPLFISSHKIMLKAIYCQHVNITQ